MNRNPAQYFVGVILLFLFLSTLSGCIWKKNITTTSELWEAIREGPVTLLTNDTALYFLTKATFSRSAIEGTGTVQKNGLKESFQGSIPFSSIAYIQGKGSLPANTLAVATATALTLYVLTAQGSAQEFVVQRKAGGGSCPFAYSWDGRSYRLEGETFGIGFGRGLELETHCTLTQLRPDSDVLRVRLTNERPETHYVNFIGLSAVSLLKDESLVLESDGTMWPTRELVPPLSAFDRGGNNILTLCRSQDGIYWESDLSGISRWGDYLDVIDVTLPTPPRGNSGSLIIHAINTDLITSIYANVFGFLGDQALLFLQSAEHDPETIASLKGWIQEASMKVFLLTSDGYILAGSVAPEASAVPFTKAVRVNLVDQSTDSVRLRLVCLADVWKIDALEVDWSDVQPLTASPLPLHKVDGPQGADVEGHITARDDERAILFPGDRLDLEFDLPGTDKGTRMAYVLSAKGYLHEWIPQGDLKSELALAHVVPQALRTEYLKELIKQRELLLGPVYAGWVKQTNR